jgi:hypothetical protein
VDHIWRSEPLLPLIERRRLIRAINDTFGGKADEQAPYLFHGLRRARKARSAGEPWGALLTDCFRQVIDEYGCYLQAICDKQLQWPPDMAPSEL